MLLSTFWRICISCIWTHVFSSCKSNIGLILDFLTSYTSVEKLKRNVYIYSARTHSIMKMSFLSLLISHNINYISNLNSISDYILKVSEKKKTITAHKTERFNNLSNRWQRLQNLLGVEATAWRCALVHCILWGFSVWFHAIPFNSLCTGVEFCVEDVQVSLLPCL